MCRSRAKFLAGGALLGCLAVGLLLASPSGPLPAEGAAGAVRLAQLPEPKAPEKEPAWVETVTSLLDQAKLTYKVEENAKKVKMIKVFYELDAETSTIWIEKGPWWATFGEAKTRKESLAIWTEVLRLPSGSTPSAAMLTKVAEMNTFFNNSFALLGVKGGTVYAQCGLFLHNLDHDLLMHHVIIMHKLRVQHRRALAPFLSSE